MRTIDFKYKKIKCFLLMILVLLLKTLSYSQTFEKYYISELDDYVYDAVAINEEEVVFAVNSGDYATYNYQTKLIKMNHLTGEILESTEIPLNYGDYIFTGTSDLLLLHDSVLILIGTCYNPASSDYTLSLIHYNLTFDMLFDTILLGNNFRKLEIHLHNDNLLYLTGFYQYTVQFIEERDIYGNLIRQQTYNFDAYLASAIIRTTDQYHMYLSHDTYCRYALINLDNLSVDTVLNYPVGFSPRNTIAGHNPSHYYVAGRQFDLNMPLPPGPLNRNLAYLRVMETGEIEEINEFHTDSMNYYSVNSFSINEDFIFFGGTHMPTWPASYQLYMYPGPRWLLMYKLTQDGEVVWQKFYKGEVDYMMYKVLATPDGGALIFSTRYDWNDPIPNQRDVHILKVDSDGNYIVGIDEVKIETKQILAYPNPATDMINFAFGLYNNLEISIFDNQGKRVHTKTHQQSASIDIAHFKPGMYFYTIHGRNGFAESGKFIKQ
jgi:hypothetical protein